MQKQVNESYHLTKGCRKTVIILHVPSINGTYVHAGPVSEHRQRVSMLLLLTKKKILPMNVSPADKAILSCLSSQGKAYLAFVQLTIKASVQINKTRNSRAEELFVNF